MTNNSDKRVFVGITGASGAIYARRLVEELLLAGTGRVLLACSGAARRVIADEEDRRLKPDGSNLGEWLSVDAEALGRVEWLSVQDIGGGPASGNYPLDAMAIAPCSMRTLAAVASGISDNLITRAADVCLKEQRRLVLLPRETPLSALHLENMLRLARLGVRIVPPAPGFYHRPQSIEDLLRYVVQKTVEQMGLSVREPIRWTGDAPTEGGEGPA